MNESVYHSFAEGIVFKQSRFFAFHNAVAFISLNYIQYITVTENFVKRIQKTLKAKFSHGKQI